jgi:hypothetical protein
MTQLSVNLNKVALLRNSRGKNFPNLLRVAKDVIGMGAHGITLHPRPDERHARRTDVVAMKELLTEFPHIELNVEGLPSSDFLELIDLVRPHQVTLVPDAPEAITSNAGWDKYTLIISDVTLAPGIKLPYVEYTKRSTKTVGIAAVSSDDVSERLYIGANNGQSLISFGKDGSVISECKIHN